MNDFLKVSNLRLFYRTGDTVVKAVNDVSFKIALPGQALAIIGESGCGKSSIGLALLRLLPGNVAEFAGSASLNGREMLSNPETDFSNEFRWKKLSWVPQNTKGSLDPRYTINNHFEELFEIHKVPHSQRNTADLLNSVGLSAVTGRSIPDRLSGGEIQRACIALALALNPDLLILDEPTSALDPSLKGQIISLLAILKIKRGASYIFITHDIHQASALCEDFIVLYAGQVIEKGRREAVLNNPIHPYTKNLLECVEFNTDGAPPKYIPGEPPRLNDLPSGCPFRPRCSHANVECQGDSPPLEDRGGGHYAACFKF